MNFVPSEKAIDFAIKSQGLFAPLSKNRLDGRSRINFNVSREMARNLTAIRLTRLFLYISDIIRKRQQKDFCILHYGPVETEFRDIVKKKILKEIARLSEKILLITNLFMN